MSQSADGRWLLLIHQIPPKPNYLRVKVWRRLQRLGAVAIKNSVYALPWSEQAQEDFAWVLREIVADGGEASICEARFVDGLSDEQLEGLFHAARTANYDQIAADAKELAEDHSASAPGDEQRAKAEAQIARLRRRFDEVATIDFFGAPGADTVDGLLSSLEARVRGAAKESPGGTDHELRTREVRGRTWVTRKGLHIDRIACAWLIRRFIDPQAEFKFVPGKGYAANPGELRFDMFEAEFTHEGDRCSFEVLLARFALDDPALSAIAEIVHDIDLKDEKFGRPETAGIDHLVSGLAMDHKEDEARLERGAAIFADLYAYFRRKSRLAGRL